MSCFIIGEMKGLTNSQRLKYSLAVSTFLRVQAYNKIIYETRCPPPWTDNKRVLKNKEPSYYTFVDNAEETMYTMGLFLLTQNDPVGVANKLYDIIPQI